MQLSDALIREYAESEDNMNDTSGTKHEYWLGKCVGISTALAIMQETDWVTAHHALWHGARNMRRNNAAA